MGTVQGGLDLMGGFPIPAPGSGGSGGGTGGATAPPNTDPFLTWTASSDLPNSEVLAAEPPLTITNEGGAATIAMPQASATQSGYLSASDYAAFESAASGSGSGSPSGAAGGALAGTYPNPSLAGVITAGSAGDATHTLAITYNEAGQITVVTATAITFPVTSVAGRTGAITLSASDISGLGTAATCNVPASGNATSSEVVLGSDTRLATTLKRRVQMAFPAPSATGVDFTTPILVPAGTGGASSTWAATSVTLVCGVPNVTATTVLQVYAGSDPTAGGSGTDLLQSAATCSGTGTGAGITYENAPLEPGITFATGAFLVADWNSLGCASAILFVEIEEQ